ncbi:MAG TPA: class I SAM-dependent methyltransferase [Steroidobacteraceae bacterium]|nr:class I SAM-dependent methyltransferase [Steroidobacteraceae bacterium]
MSGKSTLAFDPAIRSYYDRSPEESRLESGAFRLEQLRTRELILRHAPPPPVPVLDVGGAAGAYAFWLAEAGYEVRLVDAVPRLIEVARARNLQATHPLGACAVGDARALSAASGSVQMVLLLGPLYHLLNPVDRGAALREAARVLRPGGVLLAAGISRYASALEGLSRELLVDDDFAGIVARDLADGQHRNPTARLDYFTSAYFHRPQDLRREVSEAGFEVEALYGIEGPGWILPDLEERLDDPERRDMLLSVARSLESEEAMLGSSAHLLVVGRKR